MNFQISDKVVCVDDSPSPFADAYTYPQGHVKRGTVYTVSSTEEIIGSLVKGGAWGTWVALNLVGCNALHKRTGLLTGWCSERFRRLEELKDEARARNTEHSPVHV